MKRILIVDDAIDVARMLQDALKLAHPEVPVSVVPSAEEALLESTRLSIDLLVTDLRLPGMSGFELIRKIRVRQPNTRVILMTGLTPDDQLNKQREEVAPDVFLRKPIQPSVFMDAAENLLGLKPAQVSTQGASERTSAAAQAKTTPRAEPKTALEVEKEAVLRELASVIPGEQVEPGEKQPRKKTGSLGVALETGEPADAGLSSKLSQLRGLLGALVVMLLDERGRPVAQAGDLAELSHDGQVIPSLMATLSASAKVSYLLGQTAAHSVQAYRGTGLDLLAAPVGQYALLIALRSSRSALRLAIAFEEVLSAQAELAAALEGMGLHIQSPVEVGAPEVILAEMSAEGEKKEEEKLPPEVLETPLGQDQGLEKFEELFSKKKTGQLRLQDADTFWDSASSGGTDVSQSGVLTFEQAQKLGLVPPEKKE